MVARSLRFSTQKSGSSILANSNRLRFSANLNHLLFSEAQWELLRETVEDKNREIPVDVAALMLVLSQCFHMMTTSWNDTDNFFSLDNIVSLDQKSYWLGCKKCFLPLSKHIFSTGSSPNGCWGKSPQPRMWEALRGETPGHMTLSLCWKPLVETSDWQKRGCHLIAPTETQIKAEL